MRRNWLWKTIAVVLAFTLVAAACGDDDDDGAGGELTPISLQLQWWRM